ncbi:hypothetical protein SAMN05216436_10639 [bacterium A37T11]|nr:hypothetical protein SAMN05216436_10639 [bacterium A37T11]
MSKLFFFLATIWFFVGLYFYQGATILPGPSFVRLLFWLPDLIIMGAITNASYSGLINAKYPKRIFLAIGISILFLVPKVFGLLPLILDDVLRFGQFAFSGFSQYPLRHLPASIIAIAIFLVLFVTILYGLGKGKYSYKVRRISLAFDDLPAAFDGFTITQLSDIHAGSLQNRAAVERGVALVNAQKSDLLLFTGDFVNNEASELTSLKDVFAKLNAPYGKFSILGNHDYGDYIQWENPQAKAANLDHLKAIQQEMGFKLLLNEEVKLAKDGQHITLAGVENWGLRGFHQYGDLDKTLQNVTVGQFIVLMSHDPSHWYAQILLQRHPIHLTLSGHTHGMQFGLELPGFRWSPIQYIYKQWAGIYREGQKMLYVNRGFGFLGFPGRVGIRPEITVITLRAASSLS